MLDEGIPTNTDQLIEHTLLYQVRLSRHRQSSGTSRLYVLQFSCLEIQVAK